LTTSRILACPVLAWSIVQGNIPLATGLLAYAGISDIVGPIYTRMLPKEYPKSSLQLDGYIARKYKSGTVIGSILDPAADKTLMTTLVVSLAYKGMLPCECVRLSASVSLTWVKTVPLAGIILGRDVLLSISAFYYRWISLPEPVSTFL
jgi:cardiolipin synthase